MAGNVTLPVPGKVTTTGGKNYGLRGEGKGSKTDPIFGSKS